MSMAWWAPKPMFLISINFGGNPCLLYLHPRLAVCSVSTLIAKRPVFDLTRGYHFVTLSQSQTILVWRGLQHKQVTNRFGTSWLWNVTVEKTFYREPFDDCCICHLQMFSDDFKTGCHVTGAACVTYTHKVC